MKTVVKIAIYLIYLTPVSLRTQGLPDLLEPLQEKIELARQACAEFDGGELTVGWGAVTRIDLDGNASPDWVLDEAEFSCSTAASLYCGTGGCMSHFLIHDVLSSFLNRGWTIATFGRRRVLLANVHGSLCGGINLTPCVMAHVWDQDAEEWRSVKAHASETLKQK